eukprot:1159631-Pelagomonas_calceolata.AAC.10
MMIEEKPRADHPSAGYRASFFLTVVPMLPVYLRCRATATDRRGATAWTQARVSKLTPRCCSRKRMPNPVSQHTAPMAGSGT